MFNYICRNSSYPHKSVKDMLMISLMIADLENLGHVDMDDHGILPPDSDEDDDNDEDIEPDDDEEGNKDETAPPSKLCM